MPVADADPRDPAARAQQRVPERDGLRRVRAAGVRDLERVDAVRHCVRPRAGRAVVERMVDRKECTFGMGCRDQFGDARIARRHTEIDEGTRTVQAPHAGMAARRRHLFAGDHQQARHGDRLALLCGVVVIGDRQEVEARRACRACQLRRRQPAVAVNGVRVQRASVPARVAAQRCRGRRAQRRGALVMPMPGGTLAVFTVSVTDTPCGAIL